MSRNQLHISKLEEFKLWLDQQRIAHRPGRGEYEVLQVQVRPPQWYCVFNRFGGGPGGWQKEHFTVDHRMDRLVRKFINETREEDHGRTAPSTGNAE